VKQVRADQIKQDQMELFREGAVVAVQMMDQIIGVAAVVRLEWSSYGNINKRSLPKSDFGRYSFDHNGGKKV